MTSRINLAVAFLIALGLFSTGAAAEESHRAPYVNLKYPAPSEELDSLPEALVRHGMTYVGVRYRFGGTTRETGLDCSGLMLNVFQHAGVDLPRRATDMARLGIKVDKNDLQPGDLVFFNTRKQAYSHVGLYVGDGQFLHAPSSGGQVRLEDMNGRYWVARYNGARRLIDNESNS
ncbi:MAG TPA: C40 family peptidase [Azoarcus taiwanensis]|nr:C40 family peptidase [Azoarcus taiwanensis]